MKKALKITGILILILFVIIVLLSVIAKIKEKEIADIALKRISKSIRAPLVIDDISLNLIRRFPLATVELKGVLLGSANAFGQSDTLISEEETLAYIERLYISVKSRPLFRGEFEIMKVEIKGVRFNYIVDNKGISNFAFLYETSGKESTDTTAISLDVMLRELLLRDINCNYHDSLNMISARILVPKAEVNGELKNEYLQGSAKGAFNLSDCSYKSTNLYLMRESDIDFDLNYAKDTVNIKELILKTDGADLSILGTAVIKDTIEADLGIQGSRLDIEELIKYIPENTIQDIGLKKVAGILDMNASVRGLVSDSVLPEVKMQFRMRKGKIQMADYPSLKNIDITGNLTNGEMKNNTTTSVNVTKFHAETDQSSVDMSGTLNNLDRIHYNISTNMVIELGEFKQFIPDSILQDAEGQILVKLATNGVLPDSIGSDFVDYALDRSRLDLTLNNLFLVLDSTLSLDSLSGRLTYDLHHTTARNIHINVPKYRININNTSFDASLSGKVSDPLSLGIDVKSYRIRTDSSIFYGSVKIQNSEAPEFDLASNIRLNLKEIKNILPDTLVNDLSGEITAYIVSHGKLNPDSITDQINDLVFNNSTFRVSFNNILTDMPDTMMNVRELSGKMNMKSDTIEIYHTSGKYNGIDFGIDSTRILNLYSSLIKKQGSRLNVFGQFNLGDLNYDMFAPFIAAYMDTTTTSEENKDLSDTAAENADSAVNNFTFNIKGKLGMRSMTYKDAVMENISGLFHLSDSLYLVDQFKFNGFGGNVNTSVRYEIRKGNEDMLWVKNMIEQINITSLLEDFNNFREFYKPEITSENISGILTSRFDAQALFIDDSLVFNKFYVRGDVRLEKGGIYNYPPVKEQEKNLEGIKNLDTLEFKTINSNIFVFQEAVYVPTTLVVSNKLDASALGMQTFGEDYSYHFIVFLSDIIYGKSDRRKRKQEEMGEEISSAGRKGTLVRSYSENGNRHSGLDSKKEQEKMRSRVRASEALLNVRFHPKTVNYNTGLN